MDKFERARRNMVDGQLRPNRISDPAIIAAMETLPRERFVAKQLAGIAYVDEDLALGDGRYLMEPLVLARLVQELAPGPADSALNIGCASGYDAALLGRLVDAVVAVESDGELAARASALLSELSIDNVAVVTGALVDGYAEQAPYDVILMSGAVAEVPPAIVDQLADGGRLGCVIAGGDGAMGRAELVLNIAGNLSHRPVFDAGTPLLPGFAAAQSFVF